MDKKKQNILQVLVLVVLGSALFFGSGQVMFTAWETGEYSPMPEVMDDFINPDREPVKVYGRIVTANYTGIMIPVSDLIVRLFAADELIVEYITTDVDGYFYSENSYETGQIIKVTYGEHLYLPNIPYAQDEIYFLGTFEL